MTRPDPLRRQGAEFEADLPHLADLIAERLDARSRERSRWIAADIVADHLGVEVSYVYEHAAELGARRLGTGPKARLRFRLDLVDEALHPKAGAPVNTKSNTAEPRRGGQATHSRGHVPLLPVRQTRSGV